MRMLIPLALVLGIGCGNTAPKPHLKLTVENDALVISGSGFTDVNHCVQLSLIGLSQPAVVRLGKPDCTHGKFDSFRWDFKRTGCTKPKDKLPITVFAVGDVAEVDVAAVDGKIDWGDECGLDGYCGDIGQPACPRGCNNEKKAAVSYGQCVPCGAKGQVPCNTTACDGALRPDLGTCTDRCGHAQGAPCTKPEPFCDGSPSVLTQPQPPCRTIVEKKSGGTFDVYRCFKSQLPAPATGGACECAPDSVTSCRIDVSETDPTKPSAGVCAHATFENCP